MMMMKMRDSVKTSPLAPALSTTKSCPVLEALRLTPKGQQKYDPLWHQDGGIKLILDDCSPPTKTNQTIGLSPLSISSSNHRPVTPNSAHSCQTTSTATKDQPFYINQKVIILPKSPIDRLFDEPEDNEKHGVKNKNHNSFTKGSILSETSNQHAALRSETSKQGETLTGNDISLTNTSRQVNLLLPDTDVFVSPVSSSSLKQLPAALHSPPLPSCSSPTETRSPTDTRPHTRSPILSPTLRRADVALKQYENEVKKRIKLRIDSQLDCKERTWMLIKRRAEEQDVELQVRKEIENKQQTKVLLLAHKLASEELHEDRKKQKEEQDKNKKMINDRYRAAETRKLYLQQEQERIREEERIVELQELEKYSCEVGKLVSDTQSRLETCLYKQYLPDMADRGLLIIQTQMVSLLNIFSSTPNIDLHDVTGKLQELLNNAHNAKNDIYSALDYANQKGIAAEGEKPSAPALAPAVPPAAQPAGQLVQTNYSYNAQAAAQFMTSQSAVLTSQSELESSCDSAAFHKFSEIKSFMMNVVDSGKPLTDTRDPALKKYRIDLQKAVTTRVNAISSRSGTVLRDKLSRLLRLLKGEMVDVAGCRVSTQSHPAALPFVNNLLAGKIVSQGDEAISSRHEAAFPLAAVTVGLWSELPDVGTLILAHLHRLCPYTVPFYPQPSPSQSQEDYYRCLGYKYRDGKAEEQDKFLSRMSGYMRLYASIMITQPPPDSPQSHPHGVSEAWIWISRTMNLQPHPDITATLLYDILQVAGHSLHRTFTKQFHKLLNSLLMEFLPRIRAVTSGGRMGPVTRLEICLKKWLTEGNIGAPDGVIDTPFWFTSDEDDYYY